MIHRINHGSFRSLRGRMGAGGSQEAAGLISSAAPGVALVPVVGPIAAAALLVASGVVKALGIGNGCGGSCVAATQVVNAVIPAMQQNLAAAQAQASSNGGCLTSDEQTQFAASFAALWNVIVQDCTQIGGDGGDQCISDRQRGGKYDCFVTLLDPINAMPVCAVPAAAVAPSTITVIPPSSTTVLTQPSAVSPATVSPVYIYAGIALAALLLLTPGSKSS